MRMNTRNKLFTFVMYGFLLFTYNKVVSPVVKVGTKVVVKTAKITKRVLF